MRALSLDKIISQVGAEEQHLRAVNDCFIYFRALSETRLKGKPSSLFAAVPHLTPIEPTQDVLERVRSCLQDFVEGCSGHPALGVALIILAEIEGDRGKAYFQAKLRFYYQQADLGVCYQLCLILEDLGEDIWRDEKGDFIGSRSCRDLVTNLGVVRRYLENP